MKRLDTETVCFLMNKITQNGLNKIFVQEMEKLKSLQENEVLTKDEFIKYYNLLLSTLSVNDKNSIKGINYLIYIKSTINSRAKRVKEFNKLYDAVLYFKQFKKTYPAVEFTLV